MTKNEAISFLKKHQPMPNDKSITSEEIEKYDQIRRYFLNNADSECIPLFLNSFGGKDGYGLYQMVEDVISMYNKDEVLPHILKALDNPCEYVVYWCVQIASNYPDSKLFVPLSQTIRMSDSDIKIASIIALAQLALNGIRTNEVMDVIKNEIGNSYDEELNKFAEEILQNIKDSCANT